MTTSSYQALITAPRRDAPIVFTFHGTGGDEYQFAELARQILPDAGLISPVATCRSLARCAFFAVRAKASMTWKTWRDEQIRWSILLLPKKRDIPDEQSTGSAIQTGQTSSRQFCSGSPSFSIELPCSIRSFLGYPRMSSS